MQQICHAPAVMNRRRSSATFIHCAPSDVRYSRSKTNIPTRRIPAAIHSLRSATIIRHTMIIRCNLLDVEENDLLNVGQKLHFDKEEIKNSLTLDGKLFLVEENNNL